LNTNELLKFELTSIVSSGMQILSTKIW